jgi:hypothetical protein
VVHVATSADGYAVGEELEWMVCLGAAERAWAVGVEVMVTAMFCLSMPLDAAVPEQCAPRL